MESTKKTFIEVLEFNAAAQRYLKIHPEDNKFRYALTRVAKSAARVNVEFHDRNDAINIKHCLAADDGKGEILRDERGDYKFTKDGLLKRNDERKKLLNEEVELNVYYATEVPEDLSQTDKDCFIGFVIKEEEAQ